jgi:hypothetical protein
MNIFRHGLFFRRVAITLILIMLPLSFVPRVDAAFITSDESLSSIVREQDMATVQKALEHKIVKERLRDLGYTEEEIAARLDQLSDQELHSFASQMDSLNPGGDGLGIIIAILVIVLLVILILKLWDKRIVITE